MSCCNRNSYQRCRQYEPRMPINQNGFMHFLNAITGYAARTWSAFSQSQREQFFPPKKPQRRRPCARSKPLTNNGYLNFLQDFREEHYGISGMQGVCEGAKAWNNLCPSERFRYKEAALNYRRRQLAKILKPLHEISSRSIKKKCSSRSSRSSRPSRSSRSRYRI